MRQNMRSRLAGLLGGALLSLCPAQADVIFSSVGPTNAVQVYAIYSGWSGSTQDLAYGFTPVVAGTFTGLKIGVFAYSYYASSSDAYIAAALYSNQGGAPYMLVDQLSTELVPTFPTVPPGRSFAQFATLFTGPSVSLAAGTEYWIVLMGADARSMAFAAMGGGTAVVNMDLTTCSTLCDWVPEADGRSYPMQVQVEGVIVSEPGTLLLIGSALVLAATRRRLLRG